jgi:hypothetical protein
MVSLRRLSVPLTWILLLGSICPSLLSVAVYGRRKTRICTIWSACARSKAAPLR